MALIVLIELDRLKKYVQNNYSEYKGLKKINSLFRNIWHLLESDELLKAAKSVTLRIF